MPKRRCNNWLSAYLNYTSHSEAPDKFHFWTGVSVIAGALRRQVWIDQLDFEWTPNFYIVFVAPPGIAVKTTTLNVGMRLLREIEGVQFGPDVITSQALITAMAESRVDFPVGEELHPMSAITIASGEFGTLLNPNDKEMVDALVSLWDGQRGPFEKYTKTQGRDTVINPWINILACTTPAWIAGHFPEYMIGGGFTSRCVFVAGHEKRKFSAYPRRAARPDYSKLKADLLEDLQQIAGMAGEYEISPEATEFGEKWYEMHWKEDFKKQSDERFLGYFSRKQTHTHKLARVLAAAQREELVITLDDLKLATQVVTSLEADMPKVFSQIGRTPESRTASELVSTVKFHGKISHSDLYRIMFQKVSYRDFEQLLISAIQAGLIHSRKHGNEILLFSKKEVADAEQPDEAVSAM